jgi:hypothetical protein
MISALSVNAPNLYGSQEAAEQTRFATLETLIRSKNPDIVVVQGADRVGASSRKHCAARTSGQVRQWLYRHDHAAFGGPDLT